MSTWLDRAGVTSGTIEAVDGLTGTGTASVQADSSAGSGVVEIDIGWG